MLVAAARCGPCPAPARLLLPTRPARPRGLRLVAATATASALGLGRQRSVARAVAWPDRRFWVCKRPDGTATVSMERSADAFLAFDAYSQHMPGTREVRLGGTRFFAFVAPRLGAEHLVVWRRVADVEQAADAYQAAAAMQTGGLPMTNGESLDPLSDACIRLTKCSDKAQLTAAVWRWEKLDEKDPNRYWAAGGDTWMYWESFWVPAEDAALATTGVAFGDADGAMLQPTLGDAPVKMASDAVSVLHQDLGFEDEQERMTRAALKDKAYSIVYEYNVWGSDVSRSGTGSDLWSPEARLAVTALEVVIDKFQIRSMLDCACGDATWMVPFFVAKHPELQYTGVDVVSDVIARNKQRHPDLNFLSQDLSEIPLPKGAELIFSKETVNHMHLVDAQKAIQQFAATGARYLLTNVHEDVDNFVGAEKTCHTTYIKYDYELPPFSLRKIARVVEYQGLQTSFTLFELNEAS